MSHNDSAVEVGQQFSDGTAAYTVVEIAGRFGQQIEKLFSQFLVVIIHDACGEVVKGTNSIDDSVFLKKEAKAGFSVITPLLLRLEREIAFHHVSCPYKDKGAIYSIHVKHHVCDTIVLKAFQVEYNKNMGATIKTTTAVSGVERTMRAHFLPCFNNRRVREEQLYD